MARARAVYHPDHRFAGEGLLPHGRMRTRWHWLALVVAVATLYKDLASDMDYWFPVPITTTVFYAFNFASLFTLLIAIVADYRLTPEGRGTSSSSRSRSAPASGSSSSRSAS